MLLPTKMNCLCYAGVIDIMLLPTKMNCLCYAGVMDIMLLPTKRNCLHNLVSLTYASAC